MFVKFVMDTDAGTSDLWDKKPKDEMIDELYNRVMYLIDRSWIMTNDDFFDYLSNFIKTNRCGDIFDSVAYCDMYDWVSDTKMD